MTSGQVITLHGAGRTDAGVHAMAMTANFHTQATIPCQGFLKGLNSLLPNDIIIRSVQEVDDSFHARFNALGKSYLYKIITDPTLLPTDRLYNVHESRLKNFPAIQSSLDLLLGEHDFSSFEATGSRDKSKTGGKGAVRRITHARLQHEYGRLEIRLKGNGFLRHMVRNIAGTLMLVGRDLLTVEEFRKILHGKDRSLAGPTGPAHGLFLEEVYYDQMLNFQDI